MAIHCADRDPPIVWVVGSKLRDVRSNISLSDLFTLLVYVLDDGTEISKLRNFKLIFESLGNNLKVFFHNPVHKGKLINKEMSFDLAFIGFTF